MAAQKMPRADAVFEGGGVKGIAFAGAIASAERDAGVKEWVNVAGTSAGSIVAHRDAAGVRIENRSHAAIRVPITGAVAGARYGVARSGWVLVEPGETLVALERSPAA